MSKLSEDEAQARYHDYKHGWIDGSNRRNLSSFPEPVHLNEYRNGHADGLAAFNYAMKARFQALTFVPSPWTCDGCGRLWDVFTKDGRPKGRCPKCNSGFAGHGGKRPRRNADTR